MVIESAWAYYNAIEHEHRFAEHEHEHDEEEKQEQLDFSPNRRHSSESNGMKLGHVASLIGVAILVLVANVAVSVLYMVVYGHVIDPGHEPEYYHEHIQFAGPYCSIIAGMPLMFLAGWWVAGWWQKKFGVKASLVVWLAYAIIDLAIIMMVGITFRVGALFVISFASKLVAAWYGGTVRTRKALQA
jgi:hypothetical protein